MSEALNALRGRRVRGVIGLSPASLALSIEGTPRAFLWIHIERKEAVFALEGSLPIAPDPRGSRYEALEIPMRGATILDASANERGLVLLLGPKGGATDRLRLAITTDGPRANLILTGEPESRVLWAYHREEPSGAPPAGFRGPVARQAAEPEDVERLRERIEAAFRADFERELNRRLADAERALARRLEQGEGDLARARALQADRRRGEILLAHYGEIQRGASRVGLPDPYASSPGARTEIELDPSLTPHQNAARLFQRAKKGERGERLVEQRLAQTRKSLAGLAGLRRDLLSCTPKEALERTELFLAEANLTSRARGDRPSAVPGGKAFGAPRATRPGRRSMGARDQGRPRTYATTDGWEVWVGRNNADNDRITHRLSNPHDFWFHVVGVPGSHVILRRPTRSAVPKPRTIREAAEIAAYFSKARKRPRVPVIYTERKFVSKPKRAKPGLAICTRERELDVRPRRPGTLPGRDDEDREVSS